MSDGIEAQQQAFRELGMQLFRLLQPGDDAVTYSAASVAGGMNVALRVVAAAGDHDGPEGRFRELAASDDLVAATARLRRACALPDKGTWFTARIVVTSDASASADYEWDEEPRIAVDDPEDWLIDSETFPRSPDNTPAWLAARIGEGEHSRAARERTKPAHTSMSLTLDVGGAEDPTPADVPRGEADVPEADAAVVALGTDDRQPGFLGIIRDAVAADPRNLPLRVDLIELLLEEQPELAAVEIETLAGHGANASTVQVLRARAAAALLRARAAHADSAPDSAPPADPQPPAHPLTDPQPRDERVSTAGDQDEAPVWDVERPKVALADVAGMTDVKQHLESSFLAPMRNPEMARMFGKAPRGSLLMYGPPGCGKTFIARAIAGELGASFMHATLADIVGSHWGETEKAIHALFETARSAKPCVIFFDEFDAIGGRRTSGGSNSQSLRMITSQLLEEFDGVRAANDGVYVLAATNRPWDVDPALRRPGRLDRTVLILPPDEPAREAIIRTGLRDKPAADIDAGEVARRTDEFSGADLSYVVSTAVEGAFMESLQAGVPRMITTIDLESAASRTVPSTRSWFEQVKPVLEYGVDDGTYAQLSQYLKKHRI